MKSTLIIMLLFLTMTTRSQDLKFFYSEKDFITYEKYGNGLVSIIFLHGFGASKNSWHDFYKLFDSSKYTLYLIDLKGFGNSSIPKDNKYSLLDNANIISLFINNQINSDYWIIGHSFGGGVALLQNSSSTLKRLPNGQILIDCAAYNLDNPFFIRNLKIPILNHLMFKVTSAKYRAKYTLKRILYKENYSDSIVNRYIESFKGHNKEYSFIHTAKQLIPKDYNQLIEKYDEINIPTLIIWGNQDEVLSLLQGKLLNKQIVNSKLVVIDLCGHIPHEELPSTTFEIVSKYIKSIE